MVMYEEYVYTQQMLSHRVIFMASISYTYNIESEHESEMNDSLTERTYELLHCINMEMNKLKQFY